VSHSILEAEMNQARLASAMLAFLPMWFGCYNIESATRDSITTQEEQLEVRVLTKDSVEYRFLGENYRIQGDTLSGFGVRTRSNSSEIVFDARLALSDMTFIETKEFSARQTIAFIAALGIVGYLIIKVLFPH
jgi:hypothetical protein